MLDYDLSQWSPAKGCTYHENMGQTMQQIVIYEHRGRLRLLTKFIPKTFVKIQLNLDDEIGAIKLPVAEGRETLWGKTKEAFKYIHRYHLNEYDWFLKADDDTYVVVENLRFMLRSYEKDFPFYFGCKFKTQVKQVGIRQQNANSISIDPDV